MPKTCVQMMLDKPESALDSGFLVAKIRLYRRGKKADRTMKSYKLLALKLVAILAGVFGGAVAAADTPADDFNVELNQAGDGAVITGYSGKDGIVVIPAEIEGLPVKAIAGAFRNNRNITSITIPDSVTTIGQLAFYGCRGLTSVTIPDSVTRIGKYAFQECRGLTSIAIPNSVTQIGDGVFQWCSGLTSATIPDSVAAIGESAFWGCGGLTSITIPNSVTQIGDSAFRKCSGLTSIIIPNSVTQIEDGAFRDCQNLTIINFAGDNPIKFGSGVFSGCGKFSLATQAALRKHGWKGN